MQRAKNVFLIFFIGFSLYPIIEILWRGYTHWTMSFIGGIGLIILYNINGMMHRRRGNYSLMLNSLAAASAITALELISGIIINKFFMFEIWDYSSLPLNIFGQISLFYSTLWFFLCLFVNIILNLLGAPLKKF